MRSARTRGLVLTDARAPRVLGRGDLHLAVCTVRIGVTSLRIQAPPRRTRTAQGRDNGRDPITSWQLHKSIHVHTWLAMPT